MKQKTLKNKMPNSERIQQVLRAANEIAAGQNGQVSTRAIVKKLAEMNIQLSPQSVNTYMHMARERKLIFFDNKQRCKRSVQFNNQTEVLAE